MCTEKSVRPLGADCFSFRADAHCDTVTALQKGIARHIDLDTMNQYVDLQFFALYITEEEDIPKAVAENDVYYAYYRELLRKQENIKPILKASDLDSLENGQVGAVLAIENATPVAEDSEALYRLTEKGYRSFGITWSNDNALAGGANTRSGLTDLGRERLRSMNALPMMVDLAHMNRKSFFEAMALLEKPPIVTHTCCSHFCHHPRNLEDDAIKTLAEAEGMMGITFVKKFLREDADSRMEHIIDHILYGAEIMGIEHMVIGSDFDGTDLPLDMTGQKDLPRLAEAMAARGFRQEEINGVLGENLKNYLKKMLG